MSKDWLHFSFHHFLECFVILICLAFVSHTCSIFDMNRLTMSSSLSQSIKLEVSRFLMIAVASLTKVASSSLFFSIKSLDERIFSSAIGIDTVRGAWLDKSHQLGWIEWLLSSVDLLWRNIRSITEFDSPSVSEYLVREGLVGSNSSKLKESAIIMRLSLIDKWWGKEESYKLSLILKSLVIMRRLLMFTSVFLRYFKAKLL